MQTRPPLCCRLCACMQVELEELSVRHGLAKHGSKAEMVDRLVEDLVAKVRVGVWFLCERVIHLWH